MHKHLSFLESIKIKEYHLFCLDQLTKELYSSNYYFLTLDDGTQLSGRIINIFENKVSFEDDIIGFPSPMILAIFLLRLPLV